MSNDDVIVVVEEDESPVSVKPYDPHHQPTRIVEVAEQGPAGPRGEKGDKGDPGEVLGVAFYRHVQPIAATVWTIEHNLDMQPQVTIVDSVGRVVDGTIDYNDDSTITLTFSQAFAGEAYLS